MPTRERVEALIRTVEAGQFVEALECFYVSDASMQENLEPPLRGLNKLIEKERFVLKAHRSVSTRPGSQYLLDGDRVVINWTFDFVRHDGGAFSFNELAYQTWRGDHVVEEQFYYDPGQRNASGSTNAHLKLDR